MSSLSDALLRDPVSEYAIRTRNADGVHEALRRSAD
jgi:hypothetical protein